MKQIWRGAIVVLGTALAASACTADVESGKDGEVLGKTAAALSDPLPAYNGAQVAVATNEDAIMAVWQGNSSNPQIIGQAFNQSDGTPRRVVNPVSEQYSFNAGPNYLPAVAGETASGLNHFLIVWQRNWSSTDHDILAQLVTDDGTAVPQPGQGEFVIENDTQPEDSPAVALIPDQDRWLVTYTRKDTSGATSLMARWVDVFGNVTPDPSTPALTLVSGGLHIPKGRNSISSCAGTNTAMITYNDNQVAVVTIPNLHLGTPSSISGATGLVGACSDAVGQYGVTWLQGSTKVGTRVFPSGCTALSCATASKFFLTTGSGVTSINLPVIASFSFGFGISAGLNPSSLQELAFVDIDNGGNLVATYSFMTASCAGSIQGSLGATDTIAASTADGDPNAREFIVYEPYCSNQHKVRMIGPATYDILDEVSADISD
jgi:hypothetical protein